MSFKQFSPTRNDGIIVVGLRHHKAEMSPGEVGQLVREPENPYDPMAVRLENAEGETVGHVSRKLRYGAVMDKACKAVIPVEARRLRDGGVPCKIKSLSYQ